jgi:hypothetical protein
MKALFIVFMLPLQIFSQDITGIWTGYMRTTGDNLPYELVISKINEKLSGYSLMIFTVNGNQNSGVKSIKLKNKNGAIVIEDEELVYNDYAGPSRHIKIISELILSAKDSVMTMSGKFLTRTVDFRAKDDSRYSGTVELVKQNNSAQTKLIKLLDKLNLLNSLSFISPKIAKDDKSSATVITDEGIQTSLPNKKNIGSTQTTVKKSVGIPAPKQLNGGAAEIFLFPKIENNKKILAESIERKTEIVRSVFFKSDSLVLSLYDNGIVDGDSVSVVMNGKVIIANQGLTTKAARFVIHLTPELGDSILITMIADNLGSIPPNTGLLIVEDGDDRNEIRFTGDMQMSSAVLFRRKH